jgi:hypothetical protein
VVTARKARQARSRQLASRLILMGLVLLAAGGLYGLAGFSRPMALASRLHAGSLGQLPVTSALLACPAPGSAGAIGGNIAEASAPAGSSSGRLTLTELDPTASSAAPKAVTSSPQPGELTVKRIPRAPVVPVKLATMPSMVGGQVPTSHARGGLIIAATGADAQGLDVEQLGPTGQPTARCQAPGASFWFVGPGSTKLNTDLYLLNTDSQPADANVTIQTDSGPMLGAPDSGIEVPPHSMIEQNLGQLLHSAKAIALHVTTSSGRVMAAVRQTTSESKPGIWLPASQEPATTQVLPGLPTYTGARMLYITVPGTAEARVKVTAVTPRGSYQPTGGSETTMLGHQTTAIPIPSLSGIPGSIQVSSNVPVAATVQISGGPSGAPGAFLTGAGPITEQGVVAASPAGSAGTTELVLSAPGKAATVSISVAVPGAPLTGQPGAQIVKISAHSATQVTVALPKHSPKAAVMAIIVTPQQGSGPVYAARLAEFGRTVLTVLPVIASPARIALPDVRPSLVTVLSQNSSG